MNCNKCGAELVVGVNWTARRQQTHRNICSPCERKNQPKGQHASNAEYQKARRRADASAAALIKAEARQWREAHPERHNECMADSSARRRTLSKNNGPVDDIDRRAVWGRDEGHCRIKLACDGVFVPFAEMHLDHIIPVSKGGTHTWSNVQTGCAPCNLSKGNS